MNNNQNFDIAEKRAVSPAKLKDFEMSALAISLRNVTLLEDDKALITANQINNEAVKECFIAAKTLVEKGVYPSEIKVFELAALKSREVNSNFCDAISRKVHELNSSMYVNYCNMIKLAHADREVAKRNNELSNIIYDNELEVDTKISMIQEMSASQLLTNFIQEDTTKNGSDLADELERIMSDIRSGKRKSYFKSGFDDLDNSTGGVLFNGEVTTVAGRPGSGKTTFAVSIMRQMSLFENKKSLFFSLEMPSAQLGFKICADIANVEYSKVKSGSMTDKEFARYQSVVDLIRSKELNMIIEDASDPSRKDINKIIQEARRQKRVNNIDIIFIDYLTLITTSVSYRDKVTKYSDIVEKLKSLAKELNVPIVLIAQLNRECEKRADRRPIMSDLKETGAIEEVSSAIIFTYRESYYDNSNQDFAGLVEFINAKNRHGTSCTVIAKSELEFQRFRDLKEDEKSIISNNYNIYNSAYPRNIDFSKQVIEKKNNAKK